MAPKYQKGQQVVITPVSEDPGSLRDCDLGQYAGKNGMVTDLYWISPMAGQVLYMYTVQVIDGNKVVVLHEDEIQPHIS